MSLEKKMEALTEAIDQLRLVLADKGARAMNTPAYEGARAGHNPADEDTHKAPIEKYEDKVQVIGQDGRIEREELATRPVKSRLAQTATEVMKATKATEVDDTKPEMPKEGNLRDDVAGLLLVAYAKDSKKVEAALKKACPKGAEPCLVNVPDKNLAALSKTFTGIIESEEA